MGATWLILAVLIASALSLFGFVLWVLINVPRGMSGLADEAGWKRVGWGVYLTGAWGGPYAGSDADETMEPADRRSPTRRALLVIAIVLGIELFAVVGGAVLAHSVDRSELAGAIVGLLGVALLLAVFWIVAGGRALRSEIARRGRKR